MSENEEFVETKRLQYAVFRRLMLWVVLAILLSLGALAVIFF